MPVENFSHDYPELIPKTIKSITGQQLTSMHGVKTWEEFFKKNPLKLTPAKVYYVYEIGSDGSYGNYVMEGLPQPYLAKGLADEYDQTQSDNFYRKENTRLHSEIERLLAKVDDLTVVIEAKEDEIIALKKANEKWWTEEKLPLIQQVSTLEYKCEQLAHEKESSIQALNDQYESEKRENLARAEKEAIEKRFAALESEKAERANALAGYGEIASAVAVPLLGKLTDVLMNSINKNYPNLIPSIAEKFGGDGTPAQQQQQQYELDPATAFNTGQGNAQNM